MIKKDDRRQKDPTTAGRSPKQNRYLYGQCECGGPLLEDGSCESCLLTEDGWRGEYDDLFRGRK